MNNNYEVGVTPDDNNDTRLPGSVQGEPTMGSYSTDYGQPGNLDVKDTIVVGKTAVGGDYVPVPQKSADTTNSSTTLNTTASEENLSAKFKYPNVTQDVPPAGRPGVQFEDHS